MKTRIITALILILVLFPIIAYGGWPFRLLELFVVIVGGIEMMSLSKGSCTLAKDDHATQYLGSCHFLSAFRLSDEFIICFFYCGHLVLPVIACIF